MWKKNEQAPPAATPTQAPSVRPKAAASAPASVIGPSIFIKGDLTGKEDLVIQGRLEGEVRLKANNVTVGRDGRIRADIYGQNVYVEGEVKGHLFGEQEVVIRASGKVQGDIVSPRVVLENGSNFKGSIDMEPASKPEPSPEPAPTPAPTKTAKPREASAKGAPQPHAKGAGQPQVKTGASAPDSGTQVELPKSPTAAKAPAAGNRT